MSDENNLSVNAAENIKMDEQFGRIDRQLKGVSGTLHLTDEGQKAILIDAAWELSKKTKRPVILVVRA